MDPEAHALQGDDERPPLVPSDVARILAPIVGINPDHFTVDGFYWPYPDLTLKCPRCPSCGSPNAYPLAPGLFPRGACGDDACNVFMWDLTISPIENLATARDMIEEVDENGTIIHRPKPD